MNTGARVAALFVDGAGVYAGLDGVEVWDEARDARLYPGPWPVVAHPPCARWSSLAYVNQKHGHVVGDDGGCFEAALRAVRLYGGVLEHPANSLAWRTFALPRPVRSGWARAMGDPGWTTEVSQVAYGHRARKRTWLYYVGDALPPGIDWRDSPGECIIGDLWHGNDRRLGRGDRPRMYQREALATPELFRDALLGMARSASAVPTTTEHRSSPESASPAVALPEILSGRPGCST